MAMRTVMVRFVLLLLMFYAVNIDLTKSEEDGKDLPEMEDGVYVLTEDNFDDFVKKTDTLLVEFYAPWCGHCKQLEPVYAAAAKQLAKTDPVVTLAKVDATEAKDIASRYDVNAYPTLKWFRDGETYDYDGPREEDEIVKHMLKRADPSWKPPPDTVVTLTEDNFREVVDSEELILVEFYAPWCGHCKQLAPEYEKAAKHLKTTDPPLILAKVDGTKETALAKEFDVSGYPSLKVFRRGISSEYGGGRTSAEIIKYMDGQRGTPSKEKISLKDVQSFINQDDVIVMGFFKNDNDPTYELYQAAVNDLRVDYDMGYTFDPAAAKHFKVNSGTIVVFHPQKFHTKHEPKYYTLQITTKDQHSVIKDFIESHNKPLVGHFNKDTRTKRYTDRPLVILFMTVDFSFEHREATQLWRNKFADIAKEHSDLTFAIANEEDFDEIVKGMGFSEAGEELSIGILGKGDRNYPMDGMDEWSSDDIRAFINKYKEGKLKPRLKSQAIPKKQGVVTTVVGKTFEKIVLDESKDVLIELYAPGCGHCKQLEPIYKKLAKKYTNSPGLVIAKMDATANDAPHPYDTSGFPTIYFATTKNKSNPIKFSHGRELADFVKFLKKEATVDIKTKKDEL